MSRLGRIPIALPKGVKINIQGQSVLVEGPKGKISRPIPENVKIAVEGEKAKVERSTEDKPTKSAHGLMRSVLANMVKGVSEPFVKTMVSVGVGYRMALAGTKLTVNAGLSHQVIYDIPQGVTPKLEDQTRLSLTSVDKELLGLVADKIRSIRPPEPYKGKGIRYDGEHIQLKEGKAAGGKG